MSSSSTFLDRDGTERQAAPDAGHEPLCNGRGWLTVSTDDDLYPCLDCRPHLRGRLRRRELACSG